MPGYVLDALDRFKKEQPNKPQAQPHVHTPLKYGAKVQYAKEEKEDEILGDEEKYSCSKCVEHFCITAEQWI